MLFCDGRSHHQDRQRRNPHIQRVRAVPDHPRHVNQVHARRVQQSYVHQLHYNHLLAVHVGTQPAHQKRAQRNIGQTRVVPEPDSGIGHPDDGAGEQTAGKPGHRGKHTGERISHELADGHQSEERGGLQPQAGCRVGLERNGPHYFAVQRHHALHHPHLLPHRQFQRNPFPLSISFLKFPETIYESYNTERSSERYCIK